MSNQWLRLWHDMPTDPKWRTIAKASGQRIGDVMSVYLHMLVAASNATERGRTHSFNCEDVASSLDLETEQVAGIVGAMQGRVLEGDMVKGWANRQVAREDGSAERARAWREEQKAKKASDSELLNATERNRTQTERNQTPDKIREDKNIKNKVKNTSGKPEKIPGFPLEIVEPSIIDIPLQDKTEFGISERQVGEWIAAYPAVDVPQQLRAMRQWCIANPVLRKTRRGILRFCNTWLSKAQNKPQPQQAAGYESARDKSRRLASEQLTGKKRNQNGNFNNIIDIASCPFELG